MKLYVVESFLGDQALNYTVFHSEIADEMEWLQWWIDDARNKRHPEYRLVVRIYEYETTVTYTPENPETLIEVTGHE